FAQKKQRVILLTVPSPLPDFRPDPGHSYPVTIDLCYAFGDACVTLEGYPIRLFAPSGIMQVVAYECINVEVGAGWNGSK
ncbi:MAG: hypothetical protein OER86_04665, partial [Phycisphaerae bacterium]|nr:hypothetical protein [Phycisphaerae bacterium]